MATDALGFAQQPMSVEEGAMRLVASKTTAKAWQALKSNPSSLQLPMTMSALKPLLRAGVPTELRPVVWFCISGAAAAASAAPDNHYASLWASPLPKEVAFAIAEDTAPHALPLPSHRLLRSAAGAAALRRLLTALACSGTGSSSAGSYGGGYWRGLHCIAAFVLVVFGLEREEQAFWVTAALVQERLFGYCQGQGALGAAVEPRVLEALVTKKLPRVHEHLAVKLECGMAAVAGGWFATMFTDVLPPETVARIFDATLLEGSKVLLRVALAALSRFSPCITSCSSPQQLRKVLNTRLARLYDAQGLMGCAFGGVGAMPSSRIAGLRKRALLCVEEEAIVRQRALGSVIVRRKL